MKEYDVKEVSENDYQVTDKDNGETYNVHLNHYGSPDVSRASSTGGGGGLGCVSILIWIAYIFVMPVVFFTEKIYLQESAPIFFIAAYLVALVGFIYTFFPGVKKYKFERLKKYGPRFLYILNYLTLIFSAVLYFNLPEEDSTFLFIYIMPFVGFFTIFYHIKDFHLIPVMMKKMKIKRYSFTLIYFLQWLIICAIFLYGILEPFKDVIRDFASFIICYMYMIYVDIKKFFLYRHGIF